MTTCMLTYTVKYFERQSNLERSVSLRSRRTLGRLSGKRRVDADGSFRSVYMCNGSSSSFMLLAVCVFKNTL
jgi:hypothetical protein